MLQYIKLFSISEEPVVFFELVNGRTEQTNKDATFRAVPDPENQQRVNILLAKALEYEKEWRPYTPSLLREYTDKKENGIFLIY
jgi:hypothetical protein